MGRKSIYCCFHSIEGSGAQRRNNIICGLTKEDCLADPETADKVHLLCPAYLNYGKSTPAQAKELKMIQERATKLGHRHSFTLRKLYQIHQNSNWDWRDANKVLKESLEQLSEGSGVGIGESDETNNNHHLEPASKKVKRNPKVARKARRTKSESSNSSDSYVEYDDKEDESQDLLMLSDLVSNAPLPSHVTNISNVNGDYTIPQSSAMVAQAQQSQSTPVSATTSHTSFHFQLPPLLGSGDGGSTTGMNSAVFKLPLMPFNIHDVDLSNTQDAISSSNSESSGGVSRIPSMILPDLFATSGPSSSNQQDYKISRVGSFGWDDWKRAARVPSFGIPEVKVGRVPSTDGRYSMPNNLVPTGRN